MAEKYYRHLNLFMVKPEEATITFADLLVPGGDVLLYQLDQRLAFDGALYVKRTAEKRPKWSEIVDAVTGVEVSQLGTKSGNIKGSGLQNTGSVICRPDPQSLQIIFLLIAGLLPLIIGIVLLTPVELGKKTLLAALLISIAIFTIAAVQMSAVLLSVVLWPWSLYKLYWSETA